MIYVTVAIGQFFIILITAMGQAAGVIAASTAIVICVAVTFTTALHAIGRHLGWTR
jgi:hypothetical protein